MAEGLDIYRSDVKLPNDVGFVDHCMSGWLQGVELYKDFPIVRDDVVVDAGCGDLGEMTGLSRRSTQDAIAHLARRKLIQVQRVGPTETALYRALKPWRRS